MDEKDAKAWIAIHFGRSAVHTMQTIVDAVLEESEHQNLIAASTLGSIWVRHIVDSAQLLTMVIPVAHDGVWVDVGSGGGFPGLIVAALGSSTVVLVEPRKRRAEFLTKVIAALGLSARASVLCTKIEHVAQPAAVISARAVGYLGDVFQWGVGCSNSETQWILPKGRSAREEVETVSKTWQGKFHVEHSITDANSLIVLASGVARR